jgi:CDP-glucose 4,6-dehydratase
MNAFMEKKPVVIRNPNAIRPWQHVLDPLSGYLLLAEKLWVNGPDFSQPWNFGPNNDEAVSVSKVVEYLIKLWGEGATWELDTTHKLHEANYLRLDCSKAKSMLGWSPKVDMYKALEWTVEFYQKYQQNVDMYKIVKEQIERYELIDMT